MTKEDLPIEFLRQARSYMSLRTTCLRNIRSSLKELYEEELTNSDSCETLALQKASIFAEYIAKVDKDIKDSKETAKWLNAKIQEERRGTKR